MSSPSLIRCLKRFIGRRGKFDMAISDNFQTFISNELKTFLVMEQIKWNCILPKSPWWGAFYERLIRIIKEALKKTVGKAKLTYEEMETVLIEIEMVINSRPLTYLYEEDDEALCPSHLVVGRRLLSNSVKTHISHDELSRNVLTNRYRYLQNIIDHYWKRFSREYLSELREHHVYTCCKGNYDEFCKLLLGDVVLIRDDALKRNMWKKGKVEQLIYGEDNVIRGAVLKVYNNGKMSYLRRPLQRIIPLEVRESSEKDVTDINLCRKNRTLEKNEQLSSTNDESSVAKRLNRKRIAPEKFQVVW